MKSASFANMKNKDADQLCYCAGLNDFFFGCLVKIIPLVCKSIIQVLLKPSSVTAQAGPFLTLLEKSKTGFLTIGFLY